LFDESDEGVHERRVVGAEVVAAEERIDVPGGTTRHK